MSISSSSDASWVGKKPLRRLGGMSDALAIASDLGFSVPPPHSTTSAAPINQHDDAQNMYTTTGDKCDDLIRVLRELTTVQRNMASLKVEVQGRKDDKNVAHLTHVSEMEKKCDSIARITAILKEVIQNKDRVIARLQQPYSLDCIPVEAEYQKQFSELLLKAASDYEALTASVVDFQWSQNFRESPSVWGEMLRPIPVALASCTRYLEAMSAMRESVATLQQLRVGPSSLPVTPAKDGPEGGGEPECVTPPPWREEVSSDDLVIRSNRGQVSETQDAEEDEESQLSSLSQSDIISQRRLSWPPSIKKSL